MPIELSYCVVNTEQRQLLRYCLDSIARERAAVPFETEVIVLDNASRDGSAGTARAHGATTEVIALEQRRGKGENDSTLLRDWGARALRLRTIEILVHRDNGPSRAVALRAGFADTGELRTLPRDPDPGPPALIVYLWEA